MTLDSSNPIGLYIAIGTYFVLLIAAALTAYRWNKAAAKKSAQATGDIKRHDVIENHYLGNRSFGALLSTGSMFASFFSGYTVVGVPEMAYETGWISLQWCAATMTIVLGMLAIAPRIRKIGILRRHQSQVDFITDRYRSQTLRYTTVVLVLFPSIIYLTGQLVAIRGTFNTLFNIDPQSPWAVVIISALIIVFEFVGGLGSVALSDCIQGFVMVGCFICLPIIVLRHYGGWSTLDPETYPQPSFYQTPSADQQWMFWNFMLILLGSGLNPHMIQRVYAADSFKSLKFAYSVLSIGPWLATLPGIFLGTYGVQLLSDLGTAEDASSPFASILEAVMDLGGFPYVIGVIASTATLAAIMSTADSILIAISQLLTSEVFLPALPKSGPRTIAVLGRVTSLLTMAVALLITFFADQGFLELTQIQYGVLPNVIPIYVFAMYSKGSIDPHPWTLALGGVIGAAVVAILHFTYNQRAPEDQPATFAAGIVGLALNLTFVTMVEVVRYFISCISGSNKQVMDSESGSFELDSLMISSMWAWDVADTSRFLGADKTRLTADYVWGAMRNVKEPFLDVWFLALLVAVTVLVTPITEPSTPPLNGDGGFVWMPSVTNGIPSWAFQIIIVLIPMTLISLYAIRILPDNLFSEDERPVKRQSTKIEEEEQLDDPSPIQDDEP